jgi:hypothetical protein
MRLFTGTEYLDEVRISNVQRDTGWLTTQYNNMLTPNEVTLGSLTAVLSEQFTAGTVACNAQNVGQVNYVAGGAGVKDVVQVCAKDATNAYAYRSIY